ncbi:MAG: hypothetical protein WA021_05690 [Minisyncoccia bacterium]
MNAVHAVTGEGRVEGAEITAIEWARIVLHVIDMLDLSNLKNFKPLKSILEHAEDYGLQRTVGKGVYTNGWITGLSHATHFLELGSLVRPPYRWGEFPTEVKPHEDRLMFTRQIRRQIVQDTVVIDRKGQMYQLLVSWRLVEKWDNKWHETVRRWCRANRITLKRVVPETHLSASFEKKPEIALSMLHSLRIAQVETNSALDFRLTHGREKAQKLEMMLRRLGEV